MTGGQVEMPVTVRLAGGVLGGFGAQHSQSVENWFLNIAGLKLAVPGTAADAYGLITAAIADDDPVLVFEHKGLYNAKSELGERPGPVELGRADIVRSGDDVTVVATQMMRARALEAAEALAAESISVEVIDPRTLVPLDVATIADSVARTSRIVVVQEAQPGGSWGETVIARVAAELFEHLDAPPVLVAADPTPVPFAEPMERAWMPNPDRIAEAIRGALGVGPAVG
jgi:pyruvate dehydrogenase E1 component beta subunit